MRPVWARARRRASMVASLPVLAKRTTSAEGTIQRKRSAASISAEVAAAKCDPSPMVSETTETSLL